ncbi:MAG: hypothetical protein IJO94_06795, partial [Firmicutes bacterium]|nr:hypothetical protein [Bacillota bacterium]
ITSIPVAILVLLCVLSCTRWLKEDFGCMSKQEIEEYFMLDDEKEQYLAKRETIGIVGNGLITQTLKCEDSDSAVESSENEIKKP